MVFWFLFNFLCLTFYQNETLIAIKAPHGTTLEVPDPDEVGQEHKMFRWSILPFYVYIE